MSIPQLVVDMGAKWPKEFWDWAREHGLPPRQPRGSEQNKERQRLTPKLYKQWRLEQKSG